MYESACCGRVWNGNAFVLAINLRDVKPLPCAALAVGCGERAPVIVHRVTTECGKLAVSMSNVDLEQSRELARRRKTAKVKSSAEKHVPCDRYASRQRVMF